MSLASRSRIGCVVALASLIAACRGSTGAGGRDAGSDGGGLDGGTNTGPDGGTTPSFSLQVLPDAVGAEVGGSSVAVAVTVVPAGGLTGTVKLAVDGLPGGVHVEPSAALTLGTGMTEYLVLRVDPGAQTGSFALSVNGASSALAASHPLTLAVAAHAAPPLLSGFVPLGATPDSAAYDAATGLAFVCVTRLNEIDVVDVRNARLVKRLPAPYCTSVARTSDGLRIVVGTNLEEIIEIDPVRQEIVARIPFPATPIQGGGPSTPLLTRPYAVVPTSNGTWLVFARWLTGTAVGLVQWNPKTGEVRDRTAETAGVYLVSGSPDGSKVLVAGQSSNAHAVIYDAATDTFSAPFALGNYVSECISGCYPMRAAWRGDGVHVALQIDWMLMAVLDRAGSLVANLQPTAPVDGFAYAGHTGPLVLSQPNQTGNAAALAAFNSTSYAAAGLIPAISTSAGTGFGTPLTSDDRGVLLVGFGDGLELVDATTLLPPRSTPYWCTMQPSSGSAAAQTAANLVCFNPGAPGAAWVGSEPATILPGSPGGSPPPVPLSVQPSPLAGPQTVSIRWADGWTSILPEAFSYGPSFQTPPEIGGAPGAQIVAHGFGFGFDAGSMRMTVGGAQVTGLRVQGGTGTVASVSGQVPAGDPGTVDVGVVTPIGAAVLRGGFQQIAVSAPIALSSVPFQMLYDPKRDLLYASEPTTGRVEVVSVSGRQVLGAFVPSAQPAGLALLPDGSRLAIAGFAENKVFLVDPDHALPGIAVSTADPADTAYDPRPYTLAAAVGNRVFVGLARNIIGCVSDRVREISVGDQTMVSRPTGASCGTETAIAQASPRGDHVDVAFLDSSAGELREWNAGTDLFTGRSLGILFDRMSVAQTALNLGYFLDRDLHIFSAPPDQEILNHGFQNGFIHLHPGGGLAYVTLESGFAILDANTGRVIRNFGLSVPPVRAFDNLALDASGRRVFLATATGVEVVDLGTVPLSIGGVEPRQVPSAGGATVVVYGSGFSSGATATIGGQAAAATFLDPNRLQLIAPPASAGAAAVVVTLPSGQSYVLDSAVHYLP